VPGSLRSVRLISVDLGIDDHHRGSSSTAKRVWYRDRPRQPCPLRSFASVASTTSPLIARYRIGPITLRVTRWWPRWTRSASTARSSSPPFPCTATTRVMRWKCNGLIPVGSIGVGLHTRVILGELGWLPGSLPPDSYRRFGTCSRASPGPDHRLWLSTRMSDIVATTAGVEMTGFPMSEVSVRGRSEPLAVRIVSAMNELVA
jgi:hypothetical protein